MNWFKPLDFKYANIYRFNLRSYGSYVQVVSAVKYQRSAHPFQEISI